MAKATAYKWSRGRECMASTTRSAPPTQRNNRASAIFDKLSDLSAFMQEVSKELFSV